MSAPRSSRCCARYRIKGGCRYHECMSNIIIVCFHNHGTKPNPNPYEIHYTGRTAPYDVTLALTVQKCCCSYVSSHNQVRGHRTGSSHSGAEEYPREKTQTTQRWYTHISQVTQIMPPPETYKSEIGSQPTMCQVHTGAYVSLLAPGKPDYTACHPRKDYHVYISRSTYHYAYTRQTQVNWRK